MMYTEILLYVTFRRNAQKCIGAVVKLLTAIPVPDYILAGLTDFCTGPYKFGGGENNLKWVKITLKVAKTLR